MKYVDRLLPGSITDVETMETIDYQSLTRSGFVLVRIRKTIESQFLLPYRRVNVKDIIALVAVLRNLVKFSTTKFFVLHLYTVLLARYLLKKKSNISFPILATNLVFINQQFIN